MDVRARIASWSPLQRRAALAALLVALYAIVGFWVVPPIARSQGEQALRETLGREARIEALAINPFLLSVDLQGLWIGAAEGEERFVSLTRLFVDFELSTLWHRALSFREVRVVDPFVHIEVLPDGQLAFADILERLADEAGDAADTAPPEDAAPPAVRIDLAAVEGGEIAFTDRSRPTPFEHRITPLDVTLRNFGTRPDDESPYRFAAATGAGEELEWEGSVSVVPLYSSGRFALRGVQPRTGWRYVQDDVLFEVTRGTLDVSGRYDLDARDGLRIRYDEGAVALNDLAITERDTGEVAIEVPHFEVSGIEVAYPEQTAHVAGVTARGAHLRMQRLEDGSLRLERLAGANADAAAPEVAPPAAAPAPPAAGPPWTYAVDEIALTGIRLEFDDRSTAPPVALALDPIALSVRDVTSDPERPIEVALDVAVEQGGTLALRGPVVVARPSVAFDVRVDGLELRPFEPYWSPVVHVDLSTGRFGMNGRLEAGGGGDAPRARYRGSLRIDELRTLDSRLSHDLVAWTALELEGLDARFEPTAVSLERLVLRDPAARFEIAEDGRSNLETLLATEDAGSSDAPAPSEPPGTEPDPAGGEPVEIEVGVVEIAGAALRFEDRTVRPWFETGVTGFGGTIEGLASREDARAKVALAGEVDGATPLAISGTVSPLSPHPSLDLELGFQNFALSPLTPYSGRFVGQAIDRGKLFLDLHYQLEGEALRGENVVFLDQFTLGEKVESEEALNLPVALAVALAKDRKGEIHIDLPVRGEIDDPKFSVLGIVLDALKNLITKIALSPFSVLGDLGGVDGDAMRAIAFEPGRSVLAEAEQAKLATLAGALAERPALALEITGTAATTLDRPALQQAALDLDLRRARYRELQSRWFGDKPESVEDVVLEPEVRLELLEARYEEQLGGEPTFDEAALASAPDEAARLALRTQTLTQALADRIEIAPSALRRLARSRAAAIRDHLSDVAGVAQERLFVLDVALDDAANGDLPQARLALAAH